MKKKKKKKTWDVSESSLAWDVKNEMRESKYWLSSVKGPRLISSRESLYG